MFFPPEIYAQIVFCFRHLSTIPVEHRSHEYSIDPHQGGDQPQQEHQALHQQAGINTKL